MNLTLYEALFNLHLVRTGDRELALHLAALDLLLMEGVK
jgi:hypothetical protein